MKSTTSKINLFNIYKRLAEQGSQSAAARLAHWDMQLIQAELDYLEDPSRIIQLQMIPEHIEIYRSKNDHTY